MCPLSLTTEGLYYVFFGSNCAKFSNLRLKSLDIEPYFLVVMSRKYIFLPRNSVSVDRSSQHPLRDRRHGAFAGADVGGHVDGDGVGLADGGATEEASDERAREGVTGTDRAPDLHRRGIQERPTTLPEDFAAFGPHRHNEDPAAGHGHHVHAAALPIPCLDAEQPGDGLQFLDVQLQDVASPERVLQYLLRIVRLPQVDVEHLQAAFRRGVEEAPDRLAGDGAPLCQGPEADGLRGGGDIRELIGEGNPAPCHVRVDGVDRFVGVRQVDVHGAGGGVHAL